MPVHLPIEATRDSSARYLTWLFYLKYANTVFFFSWKEADNWPIQYLDIIPLTCNFLNKTQRPGAVFICDSNSPCLPPSTCYQANKVEILGSQSA